MIALLITGIREELGESLRKTVAHIQHPRSSFLYILQDMHSFGVGGFEFLASFL